jgi:hypothetical protein
LHEAGKKILRFAIQKQDCFVCGDRIPVEIKTAQHFPRIEITLHHTKIAGRNGSMTK